MNTQETYTIQVVYPSKTDSWPAITRDIISFNELEKAIETIHTLFDIPSNVSYDKYPIPAGYVTISSK